MALRNVVIGIAGTMACMIGLTTANSTENLEFVEFGKDVPLSKAVAQLLPEDYDVKFAKGLDIHTTIDWRLGDDWKVALQDALAGRNMRAVFDAKSISIEAVPETEPEAVSKPEGEAVGNSDSALVKSKPDGNSVKQVAPGKSAGTANNAAPATGGNSAKSRLQDVNRTLVSRDGFTLYPLKKEVVESTAGTATVSTSIPDWLKDDEGNVIIPRPKPDWLKKSAGSAPIPVPKPATGKNAAGNMPIPMPKPGKFKLADSDQNHSVNKTAKNINSNERNDADVKDKQDAEGNSETAERQATVAGTVPEIKTAKDQHSGIESDDNSKASKEGTRTYVAEADSTLRATLRKWVEKDSWTLIWDSKYDYIIEAEARFGGDLVTAITAIALAMDNVRPRIIVDFFIGNNVVVISNNAADIVN